MKNHLLKSFLLIAFVALSHAGARAQAEQVQEPAGASSRAATPERPDAAKKIDEFDRVGGCDHSARLDNFAIELMNNSDATAYVVAYGPGGEGSGSGAWRLNLTRDYLVEARGIEPGRIKTVYGGPYRERDLTLVELWLIPFGAEPPATAKYENDAASFKGKFSDHQAWDGVSMGEMTGPPVGDMALAGFAEVLKVQPKAVGYVAAYNGKEDAPGAWRRVAEREAESLAEEHGVEPSRVKVIFAGYSEQTKIQLWVADADAPPPVKERKRERRPKEAVRIGAFDDYLLRYDENTRFVFKGFAEVLKADEQLTACVVIRAASAAPEDADPSAPVEPDERPKVDLVRLAESWKARLKKEYGVGEHRLVILVGPPAPEWALGEIQTWIVPPGAALPDPSAEEGEAVEEEGSEQAEGNP